MKYFLPLLLSLALGAQAQTDFNAYSGTEESLEGGWVPKLTIVTRDFQFNISPPRGWACQQDAPSRKLVFTSASGRSAITIQFTARSPRTLPDNDVLREEVLRAHPGSGILQTAMCPTSYQAGVFFDLVLMPSPGNILKVRHAYVPGPAGEVEFILSANADEFDQNRVFLMSMLRSYRVSSIRPRAT
jgi:hypothetical protein